MVVIVELLYILVVNLATTLVVLFCIFICMETYAGFALSVAATAPKETTVYYSIHSVPQKQNSLKDNMYSGHPVPTEGVKNLHQNEAAVRVRLTLTTTHCYVQQSPRTHTGVECECRSTRYRFLKPYFFRS
jgi:hypothetical protein